MGKRGISPLIATVLLIGLAVIIAIIVWAFSGDFFGDQTEYIEEDAYNAILCSGDINIETDICYVDSNTLKVSLKNRGSVNIPSLRIIVSSSSESESFEGDDFFLEPYVLNHFYLDLIKFSKNDVEELTYVLTTEGFGVCSPDPLSINADLIFGCSGGNGEDYYPDIFVEPTNLDFKTVGQEISKELYLTIGNDGDSALEITDVSITGDVVFDSDFSGFLNIAPGNSNQITVTFTPDDSDDFSGTLFIISNDPNEGSVSVPLSGTGASDDSPIY